MVVIMFAYDLIIISRLNNVSPLTLKIFSLISQSYYLLVLLVMILAFKKSRKDGIFAGSIMFFSVLLNFFLKYAFNIMRPYEGMNNLNIIETKVAPSFPSQHTQTSFTAATLSSDYTRLFYIWALLIGISRVVLGVHYLTDVLVGMIIGYGIAKISLIKKEEIVEFLHNFETRRQLFHAVFGILIAMSIYLLKEFSLIFLITLLIVAIVSSYLEKRGSRIPAITWIINTFGRSKEIPAKGVIFFIMGALLTFLIFPIEVVVPALIILSLGDSFATMIGKQYGKRKIFYNKEKSWEGTLAGIFAAFIGVSFFVGLNVAFIASLIAGIFESIDFKVDDNLVIPLAAAFVISLI